MPSHPVYRIAAVLLMFGLHLSIGSSVANAQCAPAEIQQLTASDPTPMARYGASVAIDGQYAIIGAPGRVGYHETAGAAYVLRWDAGSEQWVEEQKLTASDAALDDGFGFSVAISGSFALVGAYGDDDNGENSGSAYIFERIGDIWQQTQKLVAPGGELENRFGYSVAMRGEVAIVGSPNSYQPLDHAYLYRWDGQGWQPDGLFELRDSDGGAFGHAVDIDGDVAIVGSPSADYPNSSGRVFFLRWNGASWFIEQDVRGVRQSQTGASVSINGDRALVGVPGGVEGYDLPGSVIAYQWNPDTLLWEQQQALAASNGALHDDFGASCTLDNDMALIGAHGAFGEFPRQGLAYLYRWDDQTGQWTEDSILAPSQGREDGHFGRDVAFSGERAVIGMPEGFLGDPPGSAFAFDLHCAGPLLGLLGNCPGPMRLRVQRATPDQNVAFLYAFGTGNTRVPNGNPCAGTILGLDNTAQLAALVRADNIGTAVLNVNVPRAACGHTYVQALDLATCSTTNVQPIN